MLGNRGMGVADEPLEKREKGETIDAGRTGVLAAKRLEGGRGHTIVVFIMSEVGRGHKIGVFIMSESNVSQVSHAWE